MWETHSDDAPTTKGPVMLTSRIALSGAAAVTAIGLIFGATTPAQAEGLADDRASATASPADVADVADAAVPEADGSADATSLSRFLFTTEFVRWYVTGQYAGAYLVEVSGSTADGPTHDPAEMTTWQYIFNDVVEGARPQVVVATISPTQLRPSIEVIPDQIWLGSAALDDPPAMGPERAARLLQRAGFQDPFDAVTYRRPVRFGGSNPLFIFAFPDRTHVAVDTITHAVTPLD